MSVKRLKGTMSVRNNRGFEAYLTPHSGALLSFYGLVALFVGVMGLLVLGIYRDWQLISHRFVAPGACPTFLQSPSFQLFTASLLTALFTIICYLFVYSLARHWSSSQQLAQEIGERSSVPPPELRRMLEGLDIRERVQYVADDYPFACTCGLLRPRIILSRGLVSSLERRELEAVLLHERYHLRHYDPLKLCLSRAMGRALFFLGLGRHLSSSYERFKELAADRAAIDNLGERRYLASALLKMLGHCQPSAVGVSLLGAQSTVDLRISQSLTGAGANPSIACSPSPNSDRLALPVDLAGRPLDRMYLEAACAG